MEGGLCQAGGGGEERPWGCRRGCGRSARSQLLPINLRVVSRVSLLVAAAAGGDRLGGTGLPLVS